VGRLAVDLREPPRPNLAGWLALAGGLSVLGCIRKVRIAPMTNRKMLKPIPTVTPSSGIAGLPSGLLSAGDAVP
jgi:hypothetical protein